MADITTISIQINASTEQAVEKVNKLADVMNKALNDMGNMKADRGLKNFLSTMNGVIAAIGVTKAVSGLTDMAKEGYAAAVEAKRLSFNFEMITGSAKKAEDIMGRIGGMKLSKIVGDENIAKNVQLMMNAGNTVEASIEVLDKLGGLAVVSMQEPSVAISNLTGKIIDMQTKGNMTAKMLKTAFVDFGINAEKVVADKLGLSFDELEKKIETGMVSSGQVISILLEDIEKRFPNAVNRASDSLYGIEQRIKVQLGDTLKQLNLSFIKAFNIDNGTSVTLSILEKIEASADDIASAAKNVYDWFKSWIDLFKTEYRNIMMGLNTIKREFLLIKLGSASGKNDWNKALGLPEDDTARKIYEDIKEVDKRIAGIWSDMSGKNDASKAIATNISKGINVAIKTIESNKHRLIDNKFMNATGLANGFGRVDLANQSTLKSGQLEAVVGLLTKIKVEATETGERLHTVIGGGLTHFIDTVGKFQAATQELRIQKIELTEGSIAAAKYKDEMLRIFTPTQIETMHKMRLELEATKISENHISSYDKWIKKIQEVSKLMKHGLQNRVAGLELLQTLKELTNLQKSSFSGVDIVERGSERSVEINNERANKSEPTLKEMLEQLKHMRGYEEEQVKQGKDLIKALEKMFDGTMGKDI